jgi:hypothetical protein
MLEMTFIALAHLAFWDYRRIVLLRKWKEKGVSPSPMDTEVVNDTLLPFFLSLPPRRAAALAVEMAENLDCALETLPDEMITDIGKQGDVHALNRAVHRKMHLDEIDGLLQKERRKTCYCRGISLGLPIF